MRSIGFVRRCRNNAAFFWVAFFSAFLSVVAGRPCFRHKASSWRIQYIMAEFSLTSSMFIAMIRTALNGKKDFQTAAKDG